jgi:broad specificity phosphatase PhoE
LATCARLQAKYQQNYSSSQAFREAWIGQARNIEIGFMLQILLIRPGATEYDQQGRVQGTLDIPLCEDGRLEVEALVGELSGQPVAAIYASPCQSAQQTAAALGAAREVKVKTLDKLPNLDHGLWQGMLVTDVKTKQPKVYRQWQEQPETVCPPQGETISSAKQRVQAAVNKLIKKHKSDGAIALVVPEPLSSVVRHVLRHDELGDLWQCSSGAAKWELIDVPETVAAK